MEKINNLLIEIGRQIKISQQYFKEEKGENAARRLGEITAFKFVADRLTEILLNQE